MYGIFKHRCEVKTTLVFSVLNLFIIYSLSDFCINFLNVSFTNLNSNFIFDMLVTSVIFLLFVFI